MGINGLKGTFGQARTVGNVNPCFAGNSDGGVVRTGAGPRTFGFSFRQSRDVNVVQNSIFFNGLLQQVGFLFRPTSFDEVVAFFSPCGGGCGGYSI